MLRTKTVFIVGAGASCEVGLPVGEELKQTIAKKLDLRFEHFNTPIGSGDLAIYEALRYKFPAQINEYLTACWSIRDRIVLSASIDDFIDIHQHEEKITVCSKLAIAKSILDAEKKSKLFFENKRIDSTINFGELKNTWYTDFFLLLHQEINISNLDNIFNNVTIISFNYDRCIEHFLSHAISLTYEISLDEAKQRVAKLKIFHPYGSVGDYFGNKRVTFGMDGLPDFDTLIKSLRTYTEEIHDKDELAVMRNEVAESEALVFLGNAYHVNNMKLIVEDNNQKKDTVPKRIYGTRMGVSDADLMFVRQHFDKICNRKLSRPTYDDDYNFEDKCKRLFTEYRLALRS